MSDKFADNMKLALSKAAEEMLFEELDNDAFNKIEEIVTNHIKGNVIDNPQIRWVEHSIKMQRNTFSSTFIIKDNVGEIRKFTITPAITQLKLDDAVDTVDSRELLLEDEK